MESLYKNHNRIFPLKLAKRIINVLLFILFFDFLFFPMPILASNLENAEDLANEIDKLLTKEEKDLIQKTNEKK